MEKLTLKVEGMSCGHCKVAVEKALKGVSGVTEAEVDLSRKSVTVIYETGKAVREDIVKAISDAGYEPVG